MKNFCKIFCLFLFCLVVFSPPAVSGACCECAAAAAKAKIPLTIVYIHGFNAFDVDETLWEADSLTKAFCNKYLGDYRFNCRHEMVLWSDLYSHDLPYDLYKSGLYSSNTVHNRSKVKNTIKFQGALLNPILPLAAPFDAGAGGFTVFFRNMINDFLYQTFFVKDAPEKQKVIMDRIQAAVDKADGKFVIISHSFGAVLGTQFLEERIMNNPKNSENFVGLITSADVNTIFNANHWAKIFEEPQKDNFIKYIIENGKFWICYNHRNDAVAMNLPSALLDYKSHFPYLNCKSCDEKCSPNDKICGFIVCETTQSNFIKRINPFSYDNGKVRAHLWMVRHPKDFVKKVIAVYNENSCN